MRDLARPERSEVQHRSPEPQKGLGFLFGGKVGTVTSEKEKQEQEIFEAVRDLLLSQAAIAGESLKQKRERIRELESEVRFLKDLLTQWQAVPRPLVQPSPRSAQVPRRWKVQTKT